MAQHDYVIANQGFPAFRSDLNDALAAIVSNNSGATEPTTMFAHQMWVDTAANPSVLKIRNADNDAWITIGSIDQTNDRFILSPAGGSAAAPAVSASGDLDTGLFFPGSNVLGFATNGTEAARFNSSGNLAFPNGQGIDFSASAGGGASSSILDDYEEGFFIPTISSGITSPTYSVQYGFYTKVGRLVSFQLRVETNGGTAALTILIINGLPFTTASTTGLYGGAYFNYANSGVVNSISNNLPIMHIPSGGIRIELYQTSGSNFNGTDANNVAAFNMYISGSYFSA